MPSSEVRYQRGDHYRAYDDDLLRTRRSSSSASSSVLQTGFKRPPSLSGQRHFGSNTSAENAAVRRQINRVPYTKEEEFLTKKKVTTHHPVFHSSRDKAHLSWSQAYGHRPKVKLLLLP